MNRVARPFYLEALRIVESGADPGKVDAQIREAGFRMGPLELADLIGHDINLRSPNHSSNATTTRPAFRPSYLQRSMVEAGDLGRKSGRGFYDYTGNARPRDKRGEAPKTWRCALSPA